MGTSIRWPGPRGEHWKKLHQEIKELTPRQQEDPAPDVRSVARRCIRALQIDSAAGTGIPKIRSTLHEAGSGLVEALEELVEQGLGAEKPDDAANSAERLAFAHQDLVDLIVGPPGTVGASATRKAAERVAHELLNAQGPVREAVENSRPITISDDLFCLLYRLFFEDLVIAFIEAVVVEAALEAAVPGLTLLDTTGQLREALAEEVASLLPLPCEERKKPHRTGQSVFDVARDVLADTVANVLEEQPASGELS